MGCQISPNSWADEMNISQQSFLKLVGAIGLTGVISACASSSPFSDSRRFSSPPPPLPPVAGSSVQNSELPPLGGELSADPMLAQQNGSQTLGFPVDGVVSRDPLLDSSQVGGDINGGEGSFVAIDPSGIPTNVQARDIGGSLTVQSMLGVWTAISGANTCRVNLTQTLKQGTDRNRASAPNCPISVLASLASWKLVGSQVQFFNDNGQIIGTLLRSGNRFLGTLAGGQGISMVG